MALDLTSAISAPRFRTYLQACGGDEARASLLYIANIRLSGAALEALHLFEIILRNAMDQQLRHWNRQHGGSEDWALEPVPLLAGMLDARGKLTAARLDALNAVRRHERELSHDYVVAQLTLGTWRHLLPSHRNAMKQKLWDEALFRGFPNLFEIPPATLTQWIANGIRPAKPRRSFRAHLLSGLACPAKSDVPHDQDGEQGRTVMVRVDRPVPSSDRRLLSRMAGAQGQQTLTQESAPPLRPAPVLPAHGS